MTDGAGERCCRRRLDLAAETRGERNDGWKDGGGDRL